MNKSIRSDSSAALRTHLKTNLASLPEISTKVSLNSYIRYCHNLYCGAKNAYNQGDLRRAYVDLYKFQVLALQKIPTHKDFKVKAIDTAKQKAWLENTKRPALELLETVVYKLDQEEDIRLLHHQDFELMDEFDTPYNEEAAHPLQQPPPSITTNSPSRSSAALSVLTKLQQVPAGEVLDGAAVLPSQYVVPDFDFPDEAESEDAAGAASGAAPASGVVVGGLTIMDRAMLSYLGDGRRFAIPQPSTTTIDVQVGPSKHLFFLQDDFHTSFAGFLAALPPELQLSRPAVEMNRCFFIHLGIALGIHPFVLQSGFRSLAAAALPNAEDWEKDILASVTHYCGFVDANMLCLLWPAQMLGCRVCFISGPLSRPLISCFQPPGSGTEEQQQQADLDGLKEIVIRCSGDHFTLLRPLHAAPTGGFKVISQLVSEARAAGLVVQESQARELSGRTLDIQQQQQQQQAIYT